jgi:hypothetical protein
MYFYALIQSRADFRLCLSQKGKSKSPHLSPKGEYSFVGFFGILAEIFQVVFRSRLSSGYAFAA